MVDTKNKFNKIKVFYVFNVITIATLYFVYFALYPSVTHPKLIIVLFDGFRYDYISEITTPNLWHLAKNGVYAKHGIKCQISTITAPNVVSISTGLYQESHGVVANSMFDPVFQQNVHMFDPSDPLRLEAKWYTGEPIWQTNMQISGRKSGTYFWPTGDAEWNDIKPKHFFNSYQYSGSIPNDLADWQKQIDEFLDWFFKGGINFGMYYNERLDYVSHLNSIFSTEVENTKHQLDHLIGYLIEKCKSIPDINFIITADHGFLDIPEDYAIFDKGMWDYVDRNAVLAHTSDSITAKDGLQSTVDEIYNNLTIAVKNGIKMKFWRKSDFPEKYHYHNRRIGDILYFYDHVNGNYKKPNSYAVGTHSTLNDLKETNALFIGQGPAFKKGYILEKEDLENVDLYPLMCTILNVAPSANNGSLKRIQDAIVEQTATSLSAPYVINK